MKSFGIGLQYHCFVQWWIQVSSFSFFFRVCKPYRLYLVCFIWTPPKYLPSVPFIGTLRCCIFASLSEVVLAQSVMVLHVAAGVAWHDVLGVSVVYHVSSCTLVGWLWAVGFFLLFETNFVVLWTSFWTTVLWVVFGWCGLGFASFVGLVMVGVFVCLFC